MGNCLVLRENVVKIMKNDGKILEYKTPIKVQQVLTEFSGHAISDSLPIRHLQPNTKLLGGQLYYLVPLPPPPPSPKSGKKVKFANPEVEGARESSVVTIKLIISKQELHDMLQKGGISANMLSLVHGGKEIGEEDSMPEKSDDGCQGWKPALESIPEVN